jgi:hypothetical protein
MEVVITVNDFDKVLVKVIHEVLGYVLGEGNATIIEQYLEKKGVPMPEIPDRPEQFSEELRNIVGFGKGMVMAPAVILEETMLETVCKKLGISFAIERPCNFPLCIRNLREKYKVKERRK